ncbi:hypothetical protein FB451DRAFT_1178876 [Mycena latifolia]|nr:hypothetical protein FB451DRAFT_1178876 [Mycena latifolia]
MRKEKFRLTLLLFNSPLQTSGTRILFASPTNTSFNCTSTPRPGTKKKIPKSLADDSYQRIIERGRPFATESGTSQLSRAHYTYTPLRPFPAAISVFFWESGLNRPDRWFNHIEGAANADPPPQILHYHSTCQPFPESFRKEEKRLKMRKEKNSAHSAPAQFTIPTDIRGPNSILLHQ